MSDIAKVVLFIAIMAFVLALAIFVNAKSLLLTIPAMVYIAGMIFE